MCVCTHTQLAIDWFVDRLRTTLNVTGDACVSGMVAAKCAIAKEKETTSTAAAAAADASSDDNNNNTGEEKKDNNDSIVVNVKDAEVGGDDDGVAL